jgi:hypothetical protein
MMDKDVPKRDKIYREKIGLMSQSLAKRWVGAV